MPNRKYLARLILFSIVVCGCSPSVEVAGNYSSDRSKYQFKLNQDSTFEYGYKFEFAHEHSRGRWTQIGRKRIVLDSYTKSKTIPLRGQKLSGQDFGKENVFSVRIDIPNAEKQYYQCMVFINDALYEKRSCDSIDTILVPAPVKSIFFKLSADTRMPSRFLDTLCTEKFITQSTTSSQEQLTIIVPDSLFNYRIFDKDTLEVTRKGLRFYDSAGGKWQYVPKMKGG